MFSFEQTKWAWATVLIIGWVLWHVIGTPKTDAIFAIFINVVKPGVFTISGWIISTFPLRMSSLY